MALLSRTFYERDTVLVARELLGKQFIRNLGDRVIKGYIVETEAYRLDDEACHAHRGITKRNAPLFGPVGRVYVYQCYGIHYCFNSVARDTSVAAGGVLIRGVALENSRIDGPGRTTKALGITLEHTGVDLTDPDSELILLDASPIPDSKVAITPRIGLSKGVDKPWRFVAIE